ncbi:MAG: DUF1217 domain-containing protein [Alphaproteobacteria bacterium]|nr:DUF1217 domain-containing protein [Alphaproteobacteria bacterium]
MAGSIASGLPAVVAWKQLEKSGDAAQEKWSKQASVQQKIKYAQDVVAKAKSVDDLLNNRRFMEFALSAFALESEVDKKGLLKKVLLSDLSDQNSLANRMNDPRYRDIASTMRLKDFGVDGLKLPGVMEGLTARFIKNEFEKAQGDASPGLREAMYFKENAAKINSPYSVLGDKVLREVITTTLGIPKELAIQSVESQAAYLQSKVDLSKFKDKKFVESFIQRYLTQRDQQTAESNGTGAGLYSGLLQLVGDGGSDMSGVLDLLQGIGQRRF